MGRTQRIGDRGEAAAERYLRRRGFSVIERQWRCRYGEIDLVAQDSGGTLCFVEVKLRSAGAIASPGEFVSPSKQRRLKRAAALYLASRGDMDIPARFDVAEVYARGPETLELHYIENAFE